MGSITRKIRKNSSIAIEDSNFSEEIISPFDLKENIEAALQEQADKRRKARNKRKKRKAQLKK